MSFHESYTLAAIVTLTVEILVLVAICRYMNLAIPLSRLILAVGVANAATHPALWYLPYFFFPAAFSRKFIVAYTIIGECLVLVIEALIFKLLLFKRRSWLAVSCSAFANASSLASGILLWRVI